MPIYHIVLERKKDCMNKKIKTRFFPELSLFFSKNDVILHSLKNILFSVENLSSFKCN